MTERQDYAVPLNKNLSGWQKVRVQVDVFSTGAKPRIVKLKEDFEVNPIEGNTDEYTVSDKKLINDGSSVEFAVTVAAGIDPLRGQEVQGVTFEVKVKLDLSAMAQAIGSAVAGAIGMDSWGGTIASYLPQEMQILDGMIEVTAQNPVFELTLKKFRWEQVEKAQLTDYVTGADIKALFAQGGELWVPVTIEPQAQGKDVTFNFDPATEVWDVEGHLNWMGQIIDGRYSDETDHKCLVFDIKADPGASGANPGGGPGGTPGTNPGTPGPQNPGPPV